MSPRPLALLLPTFLSSAPLLSLTPLQLALRRLHCCCRLCHFCRLRHLFALRRLRRCCRCGACGAWAACSPHFLRPCYCVCHLRRLRRRDACGAAWQPSLPRSFGPQRSHRLRRGFRLRRFRRCAAAACIISQCASPGPRWNGGCVLVCMEARTRALTNRV